MSDDGPLVARARAGDARAFETLMNRHAGLVYNLALRLLRDAHDAEDLAQEAFVRAWRALPQYRADAQFSTWLYRIVTNLCYDRLPRLRADMAALDPDDMTHLPEDAPALDGALLSAELRAHLHRAIDALPEGFRLLVTLRHLQQMSYTDIAAATGLAEGTVKSGIHRARAQLRTALADYDGWEPTPEPVEPPATPRARPSLAAENPPATPTNRPLRPALALEGQ